MELVLGLRAQLAQGAPGFKQWGAKPLGEVPKRLASADGSSLGHAIEIKRWDELGVHGEGDGRRQIELFDLLPHITRDKLDSRLHFRHNALGFLDAREAMLAEPFVLGKGTSLLDVLLEISGNELAVSTHPALQIDKMVVVADGTMRLATCSRGWARRSCARLAASSACAACSRLTGAFGGRPGPRFSGSSSVLCRCVWICASCSLASVTAWWAARSLVAIGAQTALLSSCCTWNKSGE